MFVALKKKTSECHIERLHMDGSGRTHVVEYGLLGPVTLHYDEELHRVFWCDAGTSNIESTSVEGDDRHVFGVLHASPVSLTSLHKYIFWVNRNSRKLYWADKTSNHIIKKVALNIPEDIDRMYLTSVTPRRIKPHPCLSNNGNCSHICLLSLSNIVCDCPLGMKLKNDNKTCYEPKRCTSFDFYCSKSNICIPKEMRCNGKNDCLLGEDEFNCKKKNLCPAGMFQCQSGSCIKEELVCDLHYDCGDKSDEVNCDNHNRKGECKAEQFKCSNGRCISPGLVCDGEADCRDGEDEVNCETQTCNTGQFR